MAKSHPLQLAMNCWKLGHESCSVISLRLPKIMAGDAAAAVEAQRMVSEKVEAMAVLQLRLLTGTLGTTPEHVLSATVAHYRKGVSKNKRRLSRRAKAA